MKYPIRSSHADLPLFETSQSSLTRLRNTGSPASPSSKNRELKRVECDTILKSSIWLSRRLSLAGHGYLSLLFNGNVRFTKVVTPFCVPVVSPLVLPILKHLFPNSSSSASISDTCLWFTKLKTPLIWSLARICAIIGGGLLRRLPPILAALTSTKVQSRAQVF